MENKNTFTNKWWKQVICGVCMGTADLIPGISGGTIAFIMGFYQRLLFSIKTLNFKAIGHLCRGRFKELSETVEWKFLSAIACGMCIAFIVFANLFQFLLNHQIYQVYLYAAFFGFIAASIVLCMKDVDWAQKGVFSSLIIGILCGYVLTDKNLIQFDTEPRYEVAIDLNLKDEIVKNYNYQTKTVQNVPKSTISALIARGDLPPNVMVRLANSEKWFSAKEILEQSSFVYLDFWIFICGIIAISAMLLPGISGSYLLQVFGVYGIILEALADFIKGLSFFHFNVSAFFILNSMFLGVVFGGLTFSRVITWLFKKYPQITLALMIGFMIGASRALWPFWESFYEINLLKLSKGPQLSLIEPIMPSFFQLHTLIAFIIVGLSFFSIMYMEKMANKKEATRSIAE
ncbi:hypothetical protein BN1013_01255 [Candidatus Rubidus massiliensis]|nr:hypothetical protein BN1013_01255 [Candidatus Rubidus massiliensis]